MQDRKVKTVRALERGLDVLLQVQARRAASLHEMHMALGLPKATLLRMLQTLGQKGLIWQRLADGAYLPHVDARARSQALTLEHVAEVASPWLKALSTRVSWPSVLAMPRLDHMEIVETNSPLFRLDSATLGPVGVKLSYIHTATGRAYLAACREEEREAIIARLRPRHPQEGSEADLRTILAETRARGYATREPLHPWPDRSRQLVLRDGRRSMAVPILLDGVPVASINITWPAKRGTDDAVMLRHLGALKHTAREIAMAIERAALAAEGRAPAGAVIARFAGAAVESVSPSENS
ncbi:MULTISPECIES: IclR family transcriptional regulator domain-containing protein [unclassified Novosphingobium]|uniref:IclR family transcriptional regulator domain-containing protein n=1 Tax=Novosphingobium TaxID=165696 RepID=UPI0014483FE0|nr:MULTISPECIES: IclR family transcriptional regulator C-terminal domain-containing protein [unclassified Novosphingobium]NKJ41908.1 IclR family mhp operon transcriptional activator [Novosphingobium sp. SG720]NMN04297.1 IclR family mhp operon transcriptional activator [Novosphingobium sp. SG919]NMN85712.1 IclR family mhp operon transcriptional activator [Novosphingobium sp. SG916]